MIRLLAAARRRLHEGGRDRGMTLIELLVASTLFLLMSTVMFTTVLSGARSVRLSREYNDLNEEARVVLNRISRELREAERILAVTNPNGPGYDANANTSIKFYVDFNGNEVEEPDSPDPEHLTYTYDVAAKRVTLSAAGFDYPILAANVSFFRLTFTSRIYQRDVAAPYGIVMWEELDADTSGQYGNNNGVLDDQELGYIDAVTIDLHVLNDERRQEYRTQVDLRNRPY